MHGAADGRDRSGVGQARFSWSAIYRAPVGCPRHGALATCFTPLVTVAALLLTPAVVCAQAGSPPAVPPSSSPAAASAPSAGHLFIGALALPGSEAEERWRLRDPARFSAVHSAALITRTTAPATPDASVTLASKRFALTVIAPDIRTVHNSGLGYSINEGALWAGRGANTLVTAGLHAQLGPLSLQLAPQVASSENRRYQVIPFPIGTTTPGRSPWANPFHPPASSIDLPLRLGDRPLAQMVPGQSHLALTVSGVRAGVSTEQRWWGPTVRHPLVLGANTEGFPHAFVELADGVATPLGRVQGQWLLGSLRESAFFDVDPTNNHRALNGLLLALTPRLDSALTVGIMRVVMSSASSATPPARRAFDVFRSVGQPIRLDPLALPAGVRRDQITALFAHYAVPAAGFETWVEWARFAEPTSGADWLEYPGYSQGYTVGLQWSRPLRGGRLRLAVEATNTEPDASIRVRPVATSYTSRAVPQGFTHRGRMLANPLGPGASGQWFTADHFGDRLRVGAFAGRIRWDNATLWEPIVPQLKLEDVTLLGGLRASVRVGTNRLASRIGVEYTSAVRLSYLYQSKLLDYASGTNGGVDLPNRTLAVTWSTAAFR